VVSSPISGYSRFLPGSLGARRGIAQITVSSHRISSTCSTILARGRDQTTAGRRHDSGRGIRRSTRWTNRLRARNPVEAPPHCPLFRNATPVRWTSGSHSAKHITRGGMARNGLCSGVMSGNASVWGRISRPAASISRQRLELSHGGRMVQAVEHGDIRWACGAPGVRSDIPCCALFRRLPHAMTADSLLQSAKGPADDSFVWWFAGSIRWFSCP